MEGRFEFRLCYAELYDVFQLAKSSTKRNKCEDAVCKQDLKTQAEYQKQIFKNRLTKAYKHISKWARRKGISSYRIYDKDIPEVPLLIDLYTSIDGRSYISLGLYKRPYYVADEDEATWLSEMSAVSAQVLGILPCNVFVKVRERKKGKTQYQKIANSDTSRFVVKEGNAKFYINLSDYIDTGLFLDHRPLRLEVANTAKDKDVLNLFCYTASFSVHAMLSGATSVCSVDASNTAINWAKDNMRLNGLDTNKNNRFEKNDVFAFLNEARSRQESWDIIICDVPTFSNSKNRSSVFDVNRDYLRLCILCINLLKDGGVLYFSSNSRQLKFDSSLLMQSIKERLFIQDISSRTIPQDFRNKKIHKTWKIKKES